MGLIIKGPESQHYHHFPDEDSNTHQDVGHVSVCGHWTATFWNHLGGTQRFPSPTQTATSMTSFLVTLPCISWWNPSWLKGENPTTQIGFEKDIYIYPRGRRFTGNSCPKGVYIYEVGVGLGWGGVGMVTFLELAHMVGATQHHVPCTCTHGRCYASHGIGVGWGGDDNVLWTCRHGLGWGW